MPPFDPSGLTADFAIRVGSAVLYVLLGAFVLSVKPRRASNSALGAAFVLFGLGLIANNISFLFGSLERGTVGNSLGTIVAYLLLGFAAIALALSWAGAHRRRLLVPAVVGGALCLANIVFAFVPSPAIDYADAEDRWTSSLRSAIIGGWLVFAAFLLTTSAAELWRAGDRSTVRTALVLGLTGTLASDAGATLAFLAQALGRSAPEETLDIVRNGLVGVTYLVGILWLVRAAGSPRRRLALTLMNGLLGLTLLSFILQVGSVGNVDQAVIDAMPGLVRLASIALLALAIFRHDALGVPLSSARVALTSTATVFLVALFAMAQLLQDAIGGGAGLAVGGVVATISIVVGPKVEGLVQRRSKRERAEGAFRDAVELAWRDRQLTLEEDRKIMLLAGQLGVSVARAYEIRDAVSTARRDGTDQNR